MEIEQNERGQCDFVSKARMPTIFGEFIVYGFEDKRMKTHLALVRGDVKNKDKVPLRVHSRCLTGDALGSLRCDCREQYEKAMKKLAEEKNAIMIYLNQEGRGIGLANKIRAYSLQDGGLDTVEANHQLGLATDLRSYVIAADILRYLGVGSVMLMTNNPAKMDGLKHAGVRVEGRIPLIIRPNDYDKKYLDTKRVKMGHLIEDNE